MTNTLLKTHLSAHAMTIKEQSTALHSNLHMLPKRIPNLHMRTKLPFNQCNPTTIRTPPEITTLPSENQTYKLYFHNSYYPLCKFVTPTLAH